MSFSWTGRINIIITSIFPQTPLDWFHNRSWDKVCLKLNHKFWMPSVMLWSLADGTPVESSLFQRAQKRALVPRIFLEAESFRDTTAPEMGGTSQRGVASSPHTAPMINIPIRAWPWAIPLPSQRVQVLLYCSRSLLSHTVAAELLPRASHLTPPIIFQLSQFLLWPYISFIVRE